MRTLFSLLLLLAAASPARADDPPRLKLLFLGDNAGHKPAERFKHPPAGVRGPRHRPDLHRQARRPQPEHPRQVRRAGGLRQPHQDHARAGEGAARLRRGRQGASSRSTAPASASSTRRSTSPWSARSSAATAPARSAPTSPKPDHPIMKGFTRRSRAGTRRTSTPSTTRRTARSWSPRRRRPEGAVDVGADAGQGPRLLHRLGPRPAHLGQPRLPGPRRARHPLGRAARTPPACAAGRPAAAASPFDRPFPVPEMTAKRTDVKPFEYVDVGRKIPNYTPGRQWGVQGEPMTKMQQPLPAEESHEAHRRARGFRGQTVRHREGARRQADLHDLGRARPAVGRRDDGLPERAAAAGARAATASSSARTPTATAGRQVHRLRRQAEHPDQPALRPRRRDRRSTPPQTLFLKDTDGDGKADVPRGAVQHGWDQRDTHAGPSNLQYGLDNWVWAMQGYNDSRLTVGGEPHRFRQGFFRFKPDGSKLEFLRSTNNNTWGLGFSEEGVVFGSTANGNPSVYMPIPNRYYEAVRGLVAVAGPAEDRRLAHVPAGHRQGPAGGLARRVHRGRRARPVHGPDATRRSTGTARRSSPSRPATWSGTFVIRRDGSGFRSSNPFNLLASDDEWTAPIMAEVGPDGNVWVLDWYNYIVQHNPTPQGFKTGKGAAYESDLRDKKHGRIYRVVHEDRPAKDAGANSRWPGRRRSNWWRPSRATTCSGGGTPSGCWSSAATRTWCRPCRAGPRPEGRRDRAERRGDPRPVDAARPRRPGRLERRRDGRGRRRPEAPVGRRPAERRPGAAADRPVRRRDPGRRAGPRRRPAGPADALLALADQPPAAAAGAAVAEALGRPENVTDRWIPDAVTCAAAANGEHFLRAVAGAKQPGERLLGVVAVVAEHYARGGPVDSAGAVVARLAEADPAVADAAVRGWPRLAGQDGPEARRRHRGGPGKLDRPARPGAAGAGRPARRRLGEQAGSRKLRGRDRQDARRQGGGRRPPRSRTGSPPPASWSATRRPTRSWCSGCSTSSPRRPRRSWRSASSGPSRPARPPRPAG